MSIKKNALSIIKLLTEHKRTNTYFATKNRTSRLFALVLIPLIIFSGVIFFGCNTHTSFDNPVPDIIRLHVRANSNARGCQVIKYRVRDAVLISLENALEGVLSVEAAKRVIRRELSAVERATNSVLRANGKSQTTSVQFEVVHFPRVRYYGMTLNAGYYNALIVRIGAASGGNWWCVIYPPLCYMPQGEGEGFSYRSFIMERIFNR